MGFRSGSSVALTMLAAALAGCGGDKATAPSDDPARVATEFERAAADVGIAGSPAALAYQSTAAALRAGARVDTVEITVDGVTTKWAAFAHELQVELPASAGQPAPVPLPALRALLAWRITSAGLRAIHLMAAGNEGEIGPLLVIDEPGDEPPSQLPSALVYAEGRNHLWEAVRGRQTSSVAPTTTPCPRPSTRPAGAPPPLPCVEATFTFGFSGVEAEPFVIMFPGGNPAPNAATGTRALSMSPQTVAGAQIKLPIEVIGPPPTAGRASR